MDLFSFVSDNYFEILSVILLIQLVLIMIEWNFFPPKSLSTLLDIFLITNLSTLCFSFNVALFIISNSVVITSIFGSMFTVLCVISYNKLNQHYNLGE